MKHILNVCCTIVLFTSIISNFVVAADHNTTAHKTKPVFTKNILFSRINDTLQNPISFTPAKDDSVYSGISDYEKASINEDSEWVMFVLFDCISNDFSQFTISLAEYNTDVMNLPSITTGPQLAWLYNHYYGAFAIGYGFHLDDFDSLNIKFNTTLYSLNFGYRLINFKQFVLMPEFAFRWYHYRLLNYATDRKVSLNQYMSDRALDIRFNQMTGSLGLNLSYSICNSGSSTFNYCTIGIYAGYIFKLNDKPWIYSPGTRLTSKGKIELYPLNFGIFTTFNLYYVP